MVARIARSLNQLIDDNPRRGAVRIAHAHINDVDLRGARPGAHLIDDGKYIGRQLPDPIKLLGVLRHSSFYASQYRHLVCKPRFYHEAFGSRADVVKGIARDQV